MAAASDQASRLKGQELLAAAAEAHGVEAFNSHSTYEAIGLDTWRGIMGGIGNPWPERNKKMALRYIPGTFDGQMEVLEGDKQSYIYGIQSWKYYETVPGGQADFSVKQDPNISFIIPAFHYFFEIVDRLNHAPISKYAGSATLLGKPQDLVFVTWEQEAPHPELDQYLLYLDQESHRVTGIQYTVRDANLPGAGSVYTSILYSDYEEIDGALIPFRQTVYNKEFGQPDQYLHEFVLESFSFDAIPVSQLRPDSALPVMGDEK